MRKNSKKFWKQRLTQMSIVGIIIFFISFWLPTHYIINAQGIILPAKSVWVGSLTGGIVKEIFVSSGQWVQAGQPLLELQNNELMAQLAIAHSDKCLAQLSMHEFYASPKAANQMHSGIAAQHMQNALINYEAVAKKADDLVLYAPIEGQIISPHLNRLAGAFVPPNTEFLQIADTRDLIILIPILEEDANKIQAGNQVKARWVSTGDVFHTQIENAPLRKAKLDDYFQAIYATFGGPAPQQMQSSTLQTQSLQLEDANTKLYPIFIAQAKVPQKPNLQPQPQMRIRLAIEGKRTTIGYQLWNWIEGLLRKS